MEFDTTVQNRWKFSLGCFLAGCASFGVLGMTRAAWGGGQWFVAAILCSFGVFFVLLSLAAGEHRRNMAWVALLLNLMLPGLLLAATTLSLMFL